MKSLGVNAFDDADIEGLSNWYDRDGKIVATPMTADETLNNHYTFLWSRKTLAKFIGQYTDIYVFGGSGNLPGVFDLFDRIYFLKVDPGLQRDRLLSPLRPTPLMDIKDGDFIIWGEWLEQLAKERNIPFINAAQTPVQIFEQISGQDI
ncbi:hypothetical protein [Mucilaginibacter sp. UR6-11]|uniref:hypothetical protein n=1 Tax=Mucilaginibacter sp. UR6-11 TaxID=1435644 RepID=UPI001E2CDCF7|nr:hypothetical protein [Mucilaginibacter sp. UR6-11]MCC8424876.1 hypothetical protein [Mucilaginibacter sp. UR6-11]